MGMVVQARSRRILPVALLLALFLAPPATATVDPCAGVDKPLSDDGRQEYAQHVATVVGKGVQPEQVDIHKHMQSGNWSAVHVSTPETDDGVLFFETANGQRQFKEAWGGAADPSDKEELATWAKEQGAPEALARCFAHTVAG